MVAGGTVLPRANGLHRKTMRVEANLLVLTPPLFGRRSKLAGDAARWCSRFNVAAMIRKAIGRARHARRIRSSPGARRAWRWGKRRSGSPESPAPVAGEDDQAWSLVRALARFLAHGDHVEDGGPYGIHGGARGGPHRRRWSEAVSTRVSGMGKI
jgi:hypothetical protein